MVCSLCGIKGHNKRTCKNRDPIKDILHGIICKVITLNKELNEVEKSLDRIIAKVEKENKSLRVDEIPHDNYKNAIEKTNESQGHGKAWEIDIQKCVYDIEDPENKYKSNAKYDIPFIDNKINSKNVSIKTSCSMNIDMADIKRLLNSENLDIVCIIYKQTNDIKEAIKTIVFDFDEFKKTLIKDLKKCNYTLEGWLKLIDEYVMYVKSLSKEYYQSSQNVPENEREHLIKKKPLCKGLKYFNIAPKIDGGKQRRVQCSININKMNIKKNITEGGILFGKEYTKTVISSRRVRNSRNN